MDNSLASTRDISNSYTCSNTSDKIFLLSRKEALTDNGLDNSSRIRKPTDYAFANYCCKAMGSSDGVWWWLRSPDCSLANAARGVSTDGDEAVDFVTITHSGVVPALSISEGK